MFNVPPVNEQETADISLKYTEDMGDGREFSAILAYNHLEEFLLSDGTSGAFGGYFGVPSCAASNTASNLALINSLPPGFSFAAPGTAPSAANSVLGPYLPHTCDVKFQVSSSCALCSSKQCETDDETAAVVVGVATSVKLLQFEEVGYG